MQSRYRPVHSQVRQIILSFSPYTFSRFRVRPPTYQIHNSPLNRFRTGLLRFTVSFSRLHRASDRSRFRFPPVGVVLQFIQAIAASFTVPYLFNTERVTQYISSIMMCVFTPFARFFATLSQIFSSTIIIASVCILLPSSLMS